MTMEEWYKEFRRRVCPTLHSVIWLTTVERNEFAALIGCTHPHRKGEIFLGAEVVLLDRPPAQGTAAWFPTK